jgi:hypothetical protein
MEARQPAATAPSHSDGLTPEQARLLPFYHDLRNEIVEPDKVVVTTQYFWTKWAPRLGPTLSALVVCLRRHCYYNRATHERRDWCFPEQATLAREIGVETTKTIRAALSHPLATLFVRREARYVYDPGRGKKIRTSDIYYVAMDDPLTPEDETLLALRAAERLLVEGRVAEFGPAAAPARRPSGQKDRQIQRRPDGRKGLQAHSSAGEFARQDSASFSTPELVHEDSTCTTKYDVELLSPVVRLFEDANDAPATPAQKARLAALCTQFEEIARQHDPASSGAAWVCAAIREAVESGSSYVAPRRIAHICERWAVEGGPDVSAESEPTSGASASGGSRPLGARPGADAGAQWRRPPGAERGARPNEDDPLDGQDDPSVGGEGSVARGLVPRATGLPTPHRVGETPALQMPPNPDVVELQPVRVLEVDFPELGLSGRALWQAISDEARRHVTAPGDVALMTGSRLLGRDENTLIIGVPGRSAAERAELRLGQPLGEVIRSVLGQSFTVRFVSQGEWVGRQS